MADPEQLDSSGGALEGAIETRSGSSAADRGRPDPLGSLRLLDTQPGTRIAAIVRLAAELLDIPRTFVALADLAPESASSKNFKSEPAISIDSALGKFLRAVVEQRETIRRFEDSPASTSAHHSSAVTRTVSVGVPIAVDGHPVGVFGAFGVERGDWSVRDIELCETFALAIERELDRADARPVDAQEHHPELERSNQQLQEFATELEAQTEELQATTLELAERAAELEDVARRARFAGKVGEAIVSDLKLNDAMQRCCQAAVDHLRAAFARVWLVDPGEPVLVLVASAGCYTHLNGPHGRVPIGQFKIGKIADERRPHLTNSVIGDPRVPSQEWAKSEGMVAFAGYPLVVADRVVGVIAMFAREYLADADFEAFGTGATAISVAISNAGHFEDAQLARAAAESANRGKAQFLTVMSHELRTPLNAIGGYAELLEMGLQGPVTAAQSAALKRIQRSQRHLLGLINGILNFAKVDAGVVEYELTRVSLDEVSATCEALISPQARAKGIDLDFETEEHGLYAYSDREKTQQILLNLLSNAVKFTESGGTISLSSALSNDGEVLVRVSDTGRGIAQHELERVFQPFVQVDSTLTRREEGTGLGLAISRDLARAMHGDLLGESVIGVGSTFTLMLPRAHEAGVSAKQ